VLPIVQIAVLAVVLVAVVLVISKVKGRKS